MIAVPYDTCGNVCGMERTTIYLPAELKSAVAIEARRRRQSEAAVIRDAISQLTAGASRPAPRGGFIQGGPPLDTTRLDDYLTGFGAQ